MTLIVLDPLAKRHDVLVGIANKTPRGISRWAGSDRCATVGPTRRRAAIGPEAPLWFEPGQSPSGLQQCLLESGMERDDSRPLIKPKRPRSAAL
jgi:hypothetical protein